MLRRRDQRTKEKETPKAEENEANIFGVGVKGSKLVWISEWMEQW